MKTLSEKTCDHRDVRQRICAGIKKGIGCSGGFRMVFGSAPDMRQRLMERPRKIDLTQTPIPNVPQCGLYARLLG